MANEKHLEQLNLGRDAWNKWSQSLYFEESDDDDFGIWAPTMTNKNSPDLSNLNLSWRDLQGFDLVKANFENTNLTFANLQVDHLDPKYPFVPAIFGLASNMGLSFANFKNASLESANLKNTNLQYSNLENANLSKINLENACLIYANIQNANFKNANLKNADLRSVKAEGANFEDADCEAMNLSTFIRSENQNFPGILFQKCNFQGANLRRIIIQNGFIKNQDLQNFDFSHANFKGTDFSSTNLQSANLELANLQQAILHDTNLQNANLELVNFQLATLHKANFQNANLQGAKLAGSILRDANFNKACLTGAEFSKYWGAVPEKKPRPKAIFSGSKFTEANLRNAILKDLNLEGVNFSHAFLEKADLRQSDLTTAIFQGANLKLVNLENANLKDSDFTGANLQGANLKNTNLTGCNFTGADLKGANLNGANIEDAILKNANLSGVDLSKRNLSGKNLSEAILINADLRETILVNTNLSNAKISNAKVFGTAVWNIQKSGLVQKDLVITDNELGVITVDNLEIAQFIYLLLNNANIRYVIDSITSKVVLILGRFNRERKEILDQIRDELRNRNYLPILFDFEKPSSKDFTETITTLAKMSRFIIADITDAKAIPQELMAIVPHNPSIPIMPLIAKDYQEFVMFEHFTRYHWVLPIYQYASNKELLDNLKKEVIDPAESKANDLRPKQ